MGLTRGSRRHASELKRGVGTIRERKIVALPTQIGRSFIKKRRQGTENVVRIRCLNSGERPGEFQVREWSGKLTSSGDEGNLIKA